VSIPTDPPPACPEPGLTFPALIPPHLGLVVFEDRAEAPWLRVLKPGFRHCFCLLGDGWHWVVCDPLLGGIAMAQVLGVDAGFLAHHYRAAARRVVLTPVGDPPQPAVRLPRLLTCVEIVKRLVGLGAPEVVTPYQLYRRLPRIALDYDL
jgi:hypothetical protein